MTAPAHRLASALAAFLVATTLLTVDVAPRPADGSAEQAQPHRYPLA